jgi:hypothetical protein
MHMSIVAPFSLEPHESSLPAWFPRHNPPILPDTIDAYVLGVGGIVWDSCAPGRKFRSSSACIAAAEACLSSCSLASEINHLKMVHAGLLWVTYLLYVVEFSGN